MSQILFCKLNFFIIISSCLLLGGDCDKVDIYPPTGSEATVFTLRGKPTLYHELIDVLDYRDISSEHSDCIKKEKYDVLQVKIRARSLVASKSKRNSFGFEMTPADSLLLLVVSSLFMSIPSAPGMIGTFHAGVKYVMLVQFATYTVSEAVSFAIILHAYGYIAYTLLGAIYFARSQSHENAIFQVLQNSE